MHIRHFTFTFWLVHNSRAELEGNVSWFLCLKSWYLSNYWLFNINLKMLRIAQLFKPHARNLDSITERLFFILLLPSQNTKMHPSNLGRNCTAFRLGKFGGNRLLFVIQAGPFLHIFAQDKMPACIPICGQRKMILILVVAFFDPFLRKKIPKQAPFGSHILGAF